MRNISNRSGELLEHWFAFRFGKRADALALSHAIDYFEHRMMHRILKHEGGIH